MNMVEGIPNRPIIASGQPTAAAVAPRAERSAGEIARSADGVLDLLHRVLERVLVPLRMAGLRLRPRAALARIGREHHVEQVRRRAWELSGALRIGEGAYLNPGILVVVEQWGDLVATIGRRAAIAPGAIFVAASAPCGSHLSKLAGFNERFVRNAPITIGDDAWLGAGVVILPGVVIGRNAVVGAGAVVTKDVPDWAIVAGVPARVVGDVRAESARMTEGCDTNGAASSTAPAKDAAR